MVHNFYFDNSILRPIIKNENEHLYDALYDSLFELNLPISTSRVYFTWFSLLEAIGEGNFLEKNKKKLELCQFNAIEPFNLITKKLLYQKIYDAYQTAFTYFSTHPLLKQDILLEKIETQLNYSSNKATKTLVQDTLKRYKRFIEKSYQWSLESLAAEFAWDAICAHDFISLDQESESLKAEKRSIIRKMNEYLMRMFHDQRARGYDYDSARLTNKIFSELLTDPEYPNELDIDGNLLLEKNKDFGDCGVIHFSTFGMPDSGQTGIALTADDSRQAINRLKAQLSILQYLENAKDSKLILRPGIICFVDPNTFKIIEKIDVKDFLLKDVKAPYSF